jgi:hypothetical protein
MDIWRDRDRIRVRPSETPWSPRACFPGTSETTPWGSLSISGPRSVSSLDLSPSTSQPSLLGTDNQALTVRLCSTALDAPLTLRLWRPGERLHLPGRPEPVLVADLLTRSRVQPSARARQLILASGDVPMWLVGHAVSATALPTYECPTVFEVCWTPVAGLGVPR